MDSSIFHTGSPRNPRILSSFTGGDITANGGLALFGSFLDRSGIADGIARVFGGQAFGKGGAMYSAADLVLQRLVQIAAGEPTQDAADDLRLDPAFQEVLGGVRASQPTLSRFFASRDECDVEAARDCLRAARRRAYAVRGPKSVTLDIDTTLLPTCGAQEKAGFNGHYQAVGYHPVLIYDHETGDVLAGEPRPGGQYCSKDTDQFLERELRDLVEDLRAAGVDDVSVQLRGDSGFAAAGICKVLEELDVPYAIRLKDNIALHRKGFGLFGAVSSDPDWSRVVERHGEFMYKAGTWDRERRVVFRVSRAAGALVPDVQYIVTTRKGTPEDIFDWYRGRGDAENHIKETKGSFVRSLPHRKFDSNSFLFQLSLFAYLVFNIFRTTCLGPSLARAQAPTIQARLIRIGARVTRSGRYVEFQLSSSCRHRREYEDACRRLAATWSAA